MPLVAVVFMLATVVQLFAPTPASADAASFLGPINDRYYGARFLRDCLAQKGDAKKSIPEGSADQMLAGTTGVSPTGVSIGMWFQPDSGRTNCNDGDKVNTALQSLGFSSVGDYLLKIGYQQSTKEIKKCDGTISNGQCSTGFYNATLNIYNRVNDRDTANDIVDKNQQISAAQYYNYIRILSATCNLSIPPTGKGAKATYKQVIEDPAKAGKFITKDVEVEFTNTQSIANRAKYPIDNYDWDGQSTTCEKLLEKINGMAGSIAEWNNKNPENAVTSSAATDRSDDCNENSPTWNEETKTCADEDTPTCTIEGVGWLICPALTFVAGINDAAYSFLASNFLSVDPNLVKNANDAWSKFRDVANICFVIALLFVVYSQITSIGISNYGIKRMLPRIVVAALLVNTSFIICQLAVDVSNILGYGLSHFFVNTISIGDTPSDSSQFSVGTGLTYTGVTVAAIAGAGVLFLALSVPVLLSTFLAIAMIVLILIARQALIVLLVAIAPLAFVAYLLPNTEEWFKKWRKAFVSLLVLFPIIAVIFGASALAANILNDVAGKTGNNVLQWAALGVAALPFFVVPKALQKANDGFGDFGAKLSGWADKSRQMVRKNVGEHSQLGAYKKAWDRNQQIKRAQIQGGVYQGKGLVARAASGVNKRLNSSSITGQLGTRTAQQAAQIVNKLEAENVEASRAQIEQANLTRAELRQVANGESIKGINGKDSAMRAAAITEQFTRGDYEGAQASWNSVVDGGDDRNSKETKRIVANATARSNAKPGFIGQGSLQSLREGSNVDMSGNSLHLETQAQVGVGRYSAESISKTSNEELQYVADSNGGTVPTPMRDRAQDALGSHEISKNIGNNRAWLDYYAGRGPRP